ncbi:MFS transporter [Cryomyces antarcticus]
MRFVPDVRKPSWVAWPSSGARHSESDKALRPSENPHDAALYDNSPLPWLTFASFIIGVLVSMGGFIFGYDIGRSLIRPIIPHQYMFTDVKSGQISGFLAMPDFLRRFGQLHPDTGLYYFSNVRSGLIVALLSIGTMIGAIVAAPLADRIGRKMSVSVWCVIFTVGVIIQIAAENKWYQIMMGRWVAGLGVGALSLLVPMYQAETAPRHIRGALISTYQLFITLGIFLASCINFGTEKRLNSGAWRIPIGLGFLWAIILGVGILFFPESPRYAYRKGRIDEAKRTMTKIYGVSDNNLSVHIELEEIRVKLEAESTSNGYWREFYDMFGGPRMAYRIALGMILQMFQQLTGANYFFYYGTVIFKSTGINNPYVTQMILNGINFGTTFYGLYIIEHYGRRKSLIGSSAWMFICFLIFASVGHFALDRETPENTPKAGRAMIVFASFIFGFATTWGPMIWTIAGELYPNRYRAKAMSLSTASNWFWNFLLGFFTPFIVGDIDFRYGYVFAACNVVGGLIVYFFVIEGQGRTLEEIDTMYIEHVLPWESNKWVVPPIAQMARGGRHVSLEAGVDAVGDAEKTSAESIPDTPPVALHEHHSARL